MHGDPISSIDPSGRMSLGSVGTAMGIGAAIGGLSTAMALHASGEEVTLKAVATGAAFGAILAPLAVFSPALGLALASVGVVQTLPWATRIILDPNKSMWQKVEAGILAAASVFGARQSGRFFMNSRRVAPTQAQIESFTGPKLQQLVMQAQRKGILGNHVSFSLPAAAGFKRGFWLKRDSIIAIFERMNIARGQFIRQGSNANAPPGYQVSLGGKFNAQANVRYLWALGRDGFIRIAKDPGGRNRTRHEQLTAGEDGIIGGEVEFRPGGAIRLLDDNSGYYHMRGSARENQQLFTIAKDLWGTLGYVVQ